MKRILCLALACLVLAGCVVAKPSGTFKLLEEGRPPHVGTWSGTTMTLQVSIDGVPYSGHYVRNSSVTAGSGFATAYQPGRMPISGNSSGTSVTVDGSAMAVMTSPDGKIVQCALRVSIRTGIGQCEGADGRRFVLVSDTN